MYVNYSEPEEYNFPFTYYPTVSDVHLDAEKQKDKIPINGNDSLLVAKIMENFEYSLYKKIYNGYEEDYKIDTITEKELFFCGKISIADSINSFLILREKPELNVYYNTGAVYRELYLVNFKNNQLTSVVKLSIAWGDVNLAFKRSKIITYFINNAYFSQIDYSFAKPEMLDTFEAFIPSQEISDYVKFKKDSKFIFLYLSSYIIDENGFVELTNL